MFCARCLRAVATRRQLPVARQFSASAWARSAEPNLSTPVTETGEALKEPAASRSSCPEGTVLLGLNYAKGGQDPLAKKDEEYPEWLWSCLDVLKKESAEGGQDGVDEYCMLPEDSPMSDAPSNMNSPKLTRLILQQNRRSSDAKQPRIKRLWRRSSLPRVIWMRLHPRCLYRSSPSTYQARRMARWRTTSPRLRRETS